MPKVQVKRQPPKLDMNPMVDLAFLLVTFFMLTTTFKTEEPVLVDIPSSQSEIKMPEKDLMTITISEEGKIFFSITGKFSRDKLLKLIGSRYNLEFSEQEAKTFTLLSGFGMPVSGLKSFLNMDPQERKEIEQPGIPCDSINNELADWVVFSRITNPRIRIALRGDEKVSYPIIKQIMNTLIDNNVTRFNLITDLETEV